jgi:hypothetical protein
MSDEQNVTEPVEVQPEPTTEAQPETPQEPAEEPADPEEAPANTDEPADEPATPAAPEATASEIPETVAKLYEDAHVVALTGGAHVVLAKASPLSNHEEQRISGEFPTAQEALDDAERVAKLVSEAYAAHASQPAEEQEEPVQSNAE